MKPFLLFLVSLTTAAAWGLGGGDFVNNGGGLSEKNVLYAYEKIGDYLQMCLSTDICKLNEAQKNILQKIANGLSEEKRNFQQLQFGSEKKTPGSFMIDGLVRVARTGDTVGSPIFINVDMLYTKSADDYDPTSIPEAVAILVHEFGHHHGAYGHEELDLLGIRVSMALQKKLVSTPLVPWAPHEISATVYNADLKFSFPQVLLNVGKTIVDVSDLYKKTIRCGGFLLPSSKTPVGSLFHNIHWEKIKDKEDTLDVKIIGNVSNTCEYKNDIGIRNNDFQLSIQFRINKKDGTWEIDQKTIKMDQFRSSWLK